jgi:hypothetical protein
MGPYMIAYDLGTGGNQSSLYDIDGKCCAERFICLNSKYHNMTWKILEFAVKNDYYTFITYL